MVTHTEGPWFKNVLHAVTRIENAKGSRITHLAHHYEEDGRPCGSIESQDKSGDEIEANANLICSAPDLLIACKTSLNYLHPETCDKVFELIDNAIAKAEGRKE